MPIAIAILVAAAKAGGFLLGSIVHEVGKHFQVEHETAKASYLSIINGGEQLSPQETPKVLPSNALVLCASQPIVQSSSSRALAILSNDSLESQFDMLGNNRIPILTNLRMFAGWYQARIIAMMQSTICSLFINMKVAVSFFFGYVSDRVVERKANASMLLLFQVDICGFLAMIIFILKEATRLLMSRSKQNVSKLIGRLHPTDIQATQPRFDLLRDNTSVGDSFVVDVGTNMLLYLTMPITYVKRALAMLFENWSLHHPFQLRGRKACALLCLMLFVSMSLIGWNVSFLLDEGKPEQIIMQQSIISPNIAGWLEAAGAPSPNTHRLKSLPGDIFNRLILNESASNFDDWYCILTAMQTDERQTDLDPGRADSTVSVRNWPDEDVIASSIPQTIYHRSNDMRAAVSPVDWNTDPTYWLHSGAAPESSLFQRVLQQLPGEDLTSYGFPTKNFAMAVIKAFDGFVVSATVDETFTPRLIAQSDQFTLELLGCCPLGSESDGDTSSMPRMTFSEVSPTQELSVIQYHSKEFDGSADYSSHAVFCEEASDCIMSFAKTTIHKTSKDMDQHELSLHIYLPIDGSKINQLALIPPPRPACSVLKAAGTSVSVLELRQLALVLLVFVYCNSNGDANNEPDVAPASGISPGTDSEEVPEAEVTLVGEENGTGETLQPNSKPLMRESTALLSEFGMYWKSSSKRRRRRSSRIRNKPKYYEPEASL